ncbi:MAG: type IV secretory system conjugative DNA transfer family protein [Bacillota bacterium]|nr:type IV secretory system conjugative DNA transfer family protein [Bacillota bacterium]
MKKIAARIGIVDARRALCRLGVVLAALPFLFVADVWLLGSTAAWLHDAWVWFNGHAAWATPAQKAAAAQAFAGLDWYLRHPFATAWAWIARPSAELANPGVRWIWLALNGVTLLGAREIYCRWRARVEGKPAGARDDTHGSARWAEKRDLRRIGAFGFGPGIMLGKLDGRPVRVPPEAELIRRRVWMNRHVLVVGPPGRGKSRAYVRPNIFTAVREGLSFVVTDPKGELYRDFAAWLPQVGYGVKVYNLQNMGASDRWNPLDEIRTPLDAEVFAAVVIMATDDEQGAKKGDPFWDRAERNFLKALALYVCYDATGARRSGTMGELYDLIASGDFLVLDQKFMALPGNHPALAPYKVFRMAPENTRGGIVQGLGVRLGVFQQDDVRRLTETSDIDLRQAGRKRCAYFVICPDMQPAFNFLASLFFTFMFVRLVEAADGWPDGRLLVNVRLLLDEFANIVNIPEFERKIATVRSRGLECHVVVQSLPQFRRRYGYAWEEILGCCDVRLVLGANENQTSGYVSAMLGRTTVETKSKARVVDPVFGASAGGERETRGAVGRELMTSSEVAGMRCRVCIALLPDGTPPARLEVIDYTEFPEARELQAAASASAAGAALDRGHEGHVVDAVSRERQDETRAADNDVGTDDDGFAHMPSPPVAADRVEDVLDGSPAEPPEERPREISGPPGAARGRAPWMKRAKASEDAL